MKEIEIKDPNAAPVVEKSRTACRGILIRDGKILYNYETKYDRWTSPGGGLEEKESLTDCCIREMEEETGFQVKPGECFLRVSELIDEWNWINYYFICEIVGNGEKHFTQQEIDMALTSKWLSVKEAEDIFGCYDSYATSNPSRRSLYCREYFVLQELKNKGII